MRILVTGGRDFTNSEFLFRALDALVPRPTLIIEGGQRITDPRTREIIGSADYWAHVWAKRRNIEVLTILPNWRLHGGAAEGIQNSRLLSMGLPEIVINFGSGADNVDILSRAADAGVPVKRIQ